MASEKPDRKLVPPKRKAKRKRELPKKEKPTRRRKYVPNI